MNEYRDRTMSTNETIACAYQFVSSASMDAEKVSNLNESIDNCRERWNDLEKELCHKIDVCNEQLNMIDQLHGK